MCIDTPNQICISTKPKPLGDADIKMDGQALAGETTRRFKKLIKTLESEVDNLRKGNLKLLTVATQDKSRLFLINGICEATLKIKEAGEARGRIVNQIEKIKELSK